MMDTLPYWCVTWAVGQEHFADCRTTYDNLFLRIIDFQHRQCTDYHLKSYAKGPPEGPKRGR